MALVIAWNAYAAMRWTNPKTSEDSAILHFGVKWGFAIGSAWTLVAIMPALIFAPRELWLLGALSGILLPFASGAAGAIKSGKVRDGIRVGFWSGVVGGLMGFLIFMGIGFASVLIASLRDSTALSSFLQSNRAGMPLEFAIYSMFLFGTIWGSLAGVVGGWVGLKLYRTGEAPAATSSIPAL
jgi:hypothetical protein